ncbi:MAG: hypothetical protein ACO21B_01775, partial [Gemmobacter sp.]
MAAYVLRRLLLVIPTLIGILVINFALVQFVPGGPIEQIMARLEGSGDVFATVGGGGDAYGLFGRDRVTALAAPVAAPRPPHPRPRAP